MKGKGNQMEKIIVQFKTIKSKEENKMNIYDEILNKCASFIGCGGKIKADEEYLLNEIESLKKLLMINDDLERIKKSYNGTTKAYGKTFFVCYQDNSAYITEGRISGAISNLNEIVIKRVFKDKIPCICFVIDGYNNTYQETDINSVIDYLFLR